MAAPPVAPLAALILRRSRRQAPNINYLIITQQWRQYSARAHGCTGCNADTRTLHCPRQCRAQQAQQRRQILLLLRLQANSAMICRAAITRLSLRCTPSRFAARRSSVRTMALIHTDVFFLDNFALRQWDDPVRSRRARPDSQLHVPQPPPPPPPPLLPSPAFPPSCCRCPCCCTGGLRPPPASSAAAGVCGHAAIC